MPIPKCPCKTCDDSVRLAIIEKYGRSCHNEHCPNGWPEWEALRLQYRDERDRGRELDNKFHELREFSQKSEGALRRTRKRQGLNRWRSK